jgi:hypothetical protein
MKHGAQLEIYQLLALESVVERFDDLADRATMNPSNRFSHSHPRRNALFERQNRHIDGICARHQSQTARAP